jgi:hypothetical protein
MSNKACMKKLAFIYKEQVKFNLNKSNGDLWWLVVKEELETFKKLLKFTKLFINNIQIIFNV